MATLFVRHTVADYNVWRKKFDEFQSIGAEHGVKSAAVYQAVDNPNDVTVTHDFDTVEAARIFAHAAISYCWSMIISLPERLSRRNFRALVTKRPRAMKRSRKFQPGCA